MKRYHDRDDIWPSIERAKIAMEKQSKRINGHSSAIGWLRTT